MRTRVRKILRDIRARKARTALVSISIFIGVFGIVTLFTMGDLLVEQLEDDLDKNELAMIRSYVDLNPGVELNNTGVLDTLNGLPGQPIVEGQAVYPFSWKKAPEDEDFETSTLFAYSKPLQDIKLEPMRKIKGRYPETTGEILVERRFADKYDLDLEEHNTITVRMLSAVRQADANGEGGASSEAVPEETWTIVGVVFFPYSYQGGFTSAQPEDSVFALYDDAQRAAAFTGFSSFYARYQDFETAEVRADDFEQTLTTQTPYIPIYTQVEDPADNSAIRFARTIGGVLASLGIVALLVSGFLVINVINTIVAEQKRQIGVMKSLGATATDNFFIYSGMTLVYGIIGVIPGVVLGIPFGFFAAQGLAAESNTLIEDFGYSPRAIIIGVVMGLAVPVLASLIPVFNGTRVRIFDALTDLGIDARYGYGPVARFIERLPVPINVRQGISNVTRKRGRMAFTVLTLTVAAGAFMGVFAVFASIDKVLDEFFDTFNFHFAVTPNQAQDLDDLQTLLLDGQTDLGLIPKGPFVSIAIEIEGYEKEYDPATGPPALFANGYDPASKAYNPTLVSGSGLEENPGGVVVSRGIARDMGKSVGQTITIWAGGNHDKYTIAGIASYPYDGVWFTWDTLAALAGFRDETGQPAPRGLLLTMEDQGDPTADQVNDRIEEVDRLLLENGITANYSNIELFKESLADAIGVFRLLFNFTAALIALVGAVGLLTTLSMSIYERQKEIGVMRSIGAGSLTIVVQFLTEGLIVGLLAWLFGLPLSYLLSNILIDALQLGDDYQLTYPAIVIVIGLVGTLIVTTIASIWPSISAARKTVSDILRYQ
jgi:putative ABC transport system permease protein